MIMVVPMIVAVILGGPRADALDVMVMALLRQADLGLEAEDLLPVLAELAVHQVLAGQDLLDPLGEGVEHAGMVVEVGRLEELDLRMARRHAVGGVVDPLHQDPGEEEVGEDHDAPVAKLGGVLQARLHQREGDARVGGLTPASRSLPTSA